jgi:hypothetical protein
MCRHYPHHRPGNYCSYLLVEQGWWALFSTTAQNSTVSGPIVPIWGNPLDTLHTAVDTLSGTLPAIRVSTFKNICTDSDEALNENVEEFSVTEIVVCGLRGRQPA